MSSRRTAALIVGAVFIVLLSLQTAYEIGQERGIRDEHDRILNVDNLTVTGLLGGGLLGVSIHGQSMEPTIAAGAHGTINTRQDPDIGDIIALSCDKCVPEHQKTEVDSIVKRLMKVNAENCYWIEGDNKKNSYDSRYYGWVCPDEREVLGVVTKSL